MQKMTQGRTLKLARNGAMFEPIVLVKTSSVVEGLGGYLRGITYLSVERFNLTKRDKLKLN